MRLVAIGIVHLNGFLVALSLLPLRRSRRGATAPPFVALVFEIALIVVVGRVLQVILVIEIALAICPGVGSSARVHRSVTTVGPVERAHAKGRGGEGDEQLCILVESTVSTWSSPKRTCRPRCCSGAGQRHPPSSG